ncbi:permease-like cell division protein FtsX [Dongshaea marina]|uniref:permease-like cell division protein FtsX n=1 Tax=Dongshaea marina TaxID=2047966 RepID=UPI000D3ED20A|nr:permease-like cell division protein FtsX [Dongshaea marina]
MKAKKSSGFFQRFRSQLSQGLAELWQTPVTSLMTIAVLGVSLCLPACFHLIVKNATSVAQQWQTPTQITLFLQKDLTDQQTDSFVSEVKQLPGVERVEFISKQQALSDFRQQSGLGKALSYLDDNPLPAVLLVFPDAQHRSATAADKLRDRLVANTQQVDEGRLDVQWLQRLHGILSVIERIILIVELLLLLTLILIVANTMRLNILSHREEIEVLKLVGASDRFIMSPFLFKGFWYGTIGGLLAWILTNIATVILADRVQDLASLYQSQFHLLGLSLRESLWLIGSGIILSLVASFFTVRRHIRDIEPR